MDGSNQIFLDDGLQEKFTVDGFVKVDLLTLDEVADLSQFYYDNDLMPDDGGFYATMFHHDQQKKQDISQKICSMVGSRLKKYIRHYQPLFGNYIVKAGLNKHEVGIHQDWTYVDENRYRSFNVWTSLSPSNAKNGGMFMLPGSHRVEMPIRWTPFDCDIYNQYREGIMAGSKGLDLEPGQAVIYDSAVIHYSTYNETEDMRLACGCVFVPENVRALHYFREEDKLLVYHVSTDFFHNMRPGEKPELEPGGIELVSEHFDVAGFEALLKANMA